MRIPRLALVAYILAFVVVGADQALKYWVLDVFDLPSRTTAQVAGPFWLTMVWNRGVSFGVLNTDADWTRWALSAFALAVAGALQPAALPVGVQSRRRRHQCRRGAVALGPLPGAAKARGGLMDVGPGPKVRYRGGFRGRGRPCEGRPVR